MLEKVANFDLNLFLNFLEDGIVFFDPEGRILYANKSFLKLVRKSLSEVVGAYCYEVIHGSNSRPPFCLQARLVWEGKSAVEEFYEPYLSCRLCVYASAVKDEKGKIIGYFHLIRPLKHDDQRWLDLQLYKIIVETLPGFFYLSDHRYRVLAVNRRFREWMGTDPIGKPCYQVIHKRESPCEWCNRNEIFEKGHTIEWEICSPRDKRWYHVINTPCYLPSGECLRLSLIFDIHEKNLLENKLRELFEKNPVGIAVTNLKGQILLANQALRDLLGFSEKELGKLSALDFYENKEERQKFLEALEKAKGELKGYELYLKDRRGNRRIFLVSSRLYREKGEIWTSFQEITSFKEAQRALEESEAKFKILAENVPLGVILIDNQGKVVYFNPAAEKIFSCSREEALEKDFSSFFAQKDKYKSLWENLKNGNILTRIEIEMLKKNISFPAEIFFSHLKIRNRKFYLALVQDISERKKLEEERLRLEKYHSLELLAGGVAHDFNNLLTSLLGNLDLLEILLKEDDRSQKILEQTRKVATRAKNLARDLLFFSKGDVSSKEELEIDSFIKELIYFLTRGSSVRVHLDIPSDLPSIQIDSSYLTQIIQNLIINSLEAMPKGGDLFVKVKFDQDLLYLTIKDTGPGMSKEIISHIFEPGFTTKPKGSGLGLAVVKSLVEKLGGQVKVASIPDEGTTFQIILPTVKSERSSDPYCQEQEIFYSENKILGRVLIMDDEESIRLLLQEALNYLGVEVETAAQGEEALQKYEEAIFSGAAFDVLVLDLTVPGGKGGIWVAEKIRQRGDYNTNLILATGYSFESLKEEKLKLFDDIIRKPFTLKEFSSLIKKYLSKKITLASY